MPTNTFTTELPEGLIKALLEKAKEKPETEEVKEESPLASILGAIEGLISNEFTKGFDEYKQEMQALGTELALFVKGGKLESYSFSDLYDTLNEGEYAMLVEHPSLKVSFDGKQLLDQDGDLIPAFREIVLGEFVISTDYEAIKNPVFSSKEQTIMVSKDVALQALDLGQTIEVEFTAEGGKTASMRFTKEDSSALPIQALINGVFYIVQK